MRSIRVALVLAALLTSQSVFANEGSACSSIADACLKHGYTRADGKGKQFWQDCMRPLILGQSVKGITVTDDVVRTCRDTKIAELKQELSDLEKAS